MKILGNIIVFGLILFLFEGCPTGNPTRESIITFVNNSDKTVFTYIYPDSIIQYDSNFICRYPIYPKWVVQFDLPWREIFKNDSILYLIVLDKAIMDVVQWDTIKKNQLYLKLMRFTMKTLDSTDGKLTYP
ncbi:MAG: hypothetical protein NT007_10010 [Candidatus Kapabacteria bacterium]|nr:hypothetical protein [Candidatus Kapabacteria bacterium]